MCLLISKLTHNHENCLENIAARSALSAKAVGLFIRDSIRSWCPPCRLVGIELNPGPNHKKNKSKALVIASPSKTVTILNNNNTPKKKKRNRKRNNNSRSSQSNIGANQTKAYFDSLVNPWDNSGVRLGWGSLVDTSISTAYARGTVSSNADGSLALALLPQNYNPLAYYASGAAVASTGGLPSADGSVFANQWGAGRIISMGVRAFPDIAATAIPGVVFTGALVNLAPAAVSSLTPNDFATFPTSHMGRGYCGASATGRPIDVTSFAFQEAICNLVGVSTTTNTPYSVPYICFMGLPAATIVYYEFIINIEVTPITVHGIASAMGIGTGTDMPALSNFWPSVERLWQNISPLLPASGLIGELAAQGTGAMLNALVNRNHNSSRKRLANTKNVDYPLIELID